jgi:hypothetical protein
VLIVNCSEDVGAEECIFLLFVFPEMFFRKLHIMSKFHGSADSGPVLQPACALFITSVQFCTQPRCSPEIDTSIHLGDEEVG